MKLFCVVPFYNEIAYLPACIKSLANQSDQNFNLVLVDNASTDGSGDVARDLIKHLGIMNATVIVEPEKGTGSAADAGFRYAISQGATHIARTDADCVADTTWIAEIKRAFASDVELVWGKLSYRKDDPPVQLKDRFLFPLAVWISDVYIKAGGFPRKPLDEQDDDVVLFDAARKITSRAKRCKKVRSYTSLRRTRKYGYIRTMLYYWGRKYQLKEVDIR